MTDQMYMSSSTQRSKLYGKFKWPRGEPVIQQNFPFCSTIMNYIILNFSTSNVYSKLIRSCKWFFERNPIIVARNIFGKDIKICSNVQHDDKCCVEFDLNKNDCKIWPKNRLRYLSNDRVAFNSMLCSKIYRCEIIKIELSNVDIIFEDFKYLASSVKIAELEPSQITYANGSTVMFENVLECMPNLQKLKWSFSLSNLYGTSSPPTKISGLKNLPFLKRVVLHYLTDALIIDELITVIQNQKHIEFYFAYDHTISDAYMAELDILIDTVIKCEDIKFIVQYAGQSYKKYCIMYERLYGEEL